MYTSYTSLLALSLATAALAVPTSIVPGFYLPKYFVDTYDTPLGEADGILPELAGVDNTAGGALAYNSWAYLNNALSQLTLRNPSGTVGIATGLVTELEQGQPQWYPMNSSIPYFDQKSIDYACVLNTQALIGLPTNCTIQVTGTRFDGTTVVMELVYAPTSVLGQNYSTATFPETWTGLTAVDTEVLQSADGTTLTAPLFDNNAYIAYQKVW